MELPRMLQQLWRLRLLVAVGAIVAAVAAINAGYRIDLSPLTVTQRGGAFGAAHMVLYVDSPRLSLVTGSTDYPTLTTRAQILARFIDSEEIRGPVAAQLGVRPQDVTVQGPFPDSAGSQNVQPAAQQRANSLLGRGSVFNIFVDTEANVPTVTLFLQAPNGDLAKRLGNATAEALQAYVRKLTREACSGERARATDQARSDAAQRNRPLTNAERRQALRQFLDRGTAIRVIGAPTGGDVRDNTDRAVVVLTFVGVFVAWCVALLLGAGLVRALRRR